MQDIDLASSVAADPQVPQATKTVLAEGVDVYRRATAEGLTLSFVGSLAVQMTCPEWRWLAGALGRRPSQDVDLMGLSREERSTSKVLVDAGYSLHPAVKHSREFGVKRLIFVSESSGAKIDIFLDDLVMAHTVPLQSRLGGELPTLSEVDLLLSKLQIHEMTRNDQIDLCILLAEHELASAGGRLDDRYLADLLSRDWGFWYTATSNLQSLAVALPTLTGLPAEAAARVDKRISVLLDVLTECSKSTKWRMRARVGTRIRWYDDVQEVF